MGNGGGVTDLDKMAQLVQRTTVAVAVFTGLNLSVVNIQDYIV